MKRWQMMYLGKPFLLYGNTAEEVREKYAKTMDKGSVVLPYQDTEYHKRIDFIKRGECLCEQLGSNCESYNIPIYRIPIERWKVACKGREWYYNYLDSQLGFLKGKAI